VDNYCANVGNFNVLYIIFFIICKNENSKK
jgi:hypothetical protein